jgi:UDP-N-acetylmuramate dehydrogenase
MNLTAARGEPAALLTRARRGELLSRHTTFRVGGRAQYFFAPQNPTELVKIIEQCRQMGLRVFILGAGSNLLFSDRGFPGAVISTRDVRGIAQSGGDLDVAAGEPLSSIVAFAETRGVHALSFLCGIPGTLGGAVAMNAGIRGRAIGDQVVAVRILCADGKIRTLSAHEMDFGYRCSAVLRERWVVLSARLSQRGPDYDGDEILRRRRETQPTAFASAGCVFRNPPGVSAGELIERSGLKGLTVGRARVSEKHANFIVNLGGATSAEICKLIDIVHQKVYNTSHVSLDLEIEVIDG